MKRQAQPRRSRPVSSVALLCGLLAAPPARAGDDRDRDRDTADCKRRCDDENRPTVDSEKVAEAYRRMIEESQRRERERQRQEKKKGGGK